MTVHMLDDMYLRLCLKLYFIHTYVYVHTHVYLEREGICEMTNSFVCIFVTHAFIRVT